MSIKIIMFNDNGEDSFGPVIYCDHCGALVTKGIYVFERNNEHYDFSSDVKFYCSNGVCSRCPDAKDGDGNDKPWMMINDFVHYLLHNHGNGTKHITKMKKIKGLKRRLEKTDYQSSLTFKQLTSKE